MPSAPVRWIPRHSTSAFGARPDPDAARKSFIARHPVGRIGSPSEIAALCVYLGSDESAFTTGQALVIDGAWGL